MNLPQDFKNYLIKNNSSKATVKNYLSDLNNYFEWFSKETKINPLLNQDLFLKKHNLKILKKYKKNLEGQKISSSTIRRKFATLKKFDEFTSSENLKSEKPANEIKTTTQSPSLLSNFQTKLLKEKTNPTTVKNYLSDVNHFLNWLKEN